VNAAGTACFTRTKDFGQKTGFFAIIWHVVVVMLTGGAVEAKSKFL
jgi:hypothetical protein